MLSPPFLNRLLSSQGRAQGSAPGPVQLQGAQLLRFRLSRSSFVQAKGHIRHGWRCLCHRERALGCCGLVPSSQLRRLCAFSFCPELLWLPQPGWCCSPTMPHAVLQPEQRMFTQNTWVACLPCTKKDPGSGLQPDSGNWAWMHLTIIQGLDEGSLEGP